MQKRMLNIEFDFDVFLNRLTVHPMETNIKKVFIAAPDDFEKCYIFAPSIGKKKNIGGKTYNVTRYFNGNRDFETSMKELATKQVCETAR